MVISIAVVLFSCSITKNSDLILEDNEWRDALEVAVMFAEITSEEIDMYSYFENRKLKDELHSAYLSVAEEFGYSINDSIADYIFKRNNSKICNRLDTIMKINFVRDTIGLDEYIMISEPFYISNDLLCYSMMYKKLNASKSSHWIYYITKQNGSVKTKAIYDIKEDEFYEAQSY